MSSDRFSLSSCTLYDFFTFYYSISFITEMRLIIELRRVDDFFFRLNRTTLEARLNIYIFFRWEWEWNSEQTFLCRITFSTSTNTQEKNYFAVTRLALAFFSKSQVLHVTWLWKMRIVFGQKSLDFFFAVSLPMKVLPMRFVEHFLSGFCIGDWRRNTRDDSARRDMNSHNNSQNKFFAAIRRSYKKHEIKLQLQHRKCILKMWMVSMMWSAWMFEFSTRSSHWE